MTKQYDLILEAIDKIFEVGKYFYSDYVFKQLKDTRTLDFIEKVIEKSGKTEIEAAIILLAAIRFHQNDIYALKKIEENKSFHEYLNKNYNQLFEICVNKKVQSNAPQRGLPLVELLSQKLPNSSVFVIELGASYGLIGNCLLEPENMLKNKDLYFQSNQQMPKNIKNIDGYLGIDIDPPSKEWLISCFSSLDDAIRNQNCINNFSLINSHKVIKASAIGFSELDEVCHIDYSKYKMVILTSFMLYQLNESLQNILAEEINQFIKKHNGHWIRQEIKASEQQSSLEYFVDWDNEKVIQLPDDKCTSWNWI